MLTKLTNVIIFEMIAMLILAIQTISLFRKGSNDLATICIVGLIVLLVHIFQLIRYLYGGFTKNLIRNIIIKLLNLQKIEKLIADGETLSVFRSCKKGEKNKWGDLITYFYVYRGEIWCFERGFWLIKYDRYSDNIIFSIFIENQDIENYISVREQNEIFSITINVDGEEIGAGFDSRNIEDKYKYLEKISKFKELYGDINKDYVDVAKMKYIKFKNEIDQLKKEGFEFRSYNFNLDLINSETYFFYENKFNLLGKSNKSKEIYFKLNNEIIRNSDEDMYYEIRGFKKTELSYKIERNYDVNIDTSKEFSPKRAAIGWVLAGPIGALAMAEKKQKVKLDDIDIKKEENVYDDRKLFIYINDKSYEFPLIAYGMLKEMYPEKENKRYEVV